MENRPARIIPVGQARQFVADRTLVEVEPGRTIAETLVELGVPLNMVTIARSDGTYLPKTAIVQPGDVLRLISIIGGG